MNFKPGKFASLSVLGLSLLLGPVVGAGAAQQDPQQPPPDNSKTNQRDNPQTSPTADEQKMNPADRGITKRIRMAVMNDSTLSTYAHNVKIITRDGRVTLKGPVRSDGEKANVGAKAIAVAGDGNVDNQLDVAPAKQ